MRPLYDGQENHYKKMLDLQERLRRSEEERIRLEEKFNLLVQESRNRHQTCINQLRIRYVEFLEEQRARDERNNKLLGSLDKVDSSLAMMTAKTERLNILRKQYEAYLLRAYGTQRNNGSVTADSGLESQNEREISPTPVFSKSVALIRKNSMAYASPEFPAASRKTPDLELPEAYKLNAIQKSADIQRELNDNFARAAAFPSFYDEVKDVLKNRLYIPSYLADPPKYTSSPKPEPTKFEIGTRNSSYLFDRPKYTSTPNAETTKDQSGSRNLSLRSATNAPVAGNAPLATSTPGKYDLDRYLNKIKQAQADALELSEPERSFEDAEQEQNTSGDLLNVTLSDDGNPAAAVRSSPEEDSPPAKDSRSRFRALLMRQAYAAENGSRNRPIDRTRRSPLSKMRGGDAEEEEEAAAAAAIDKFRQSEIATAPSPPPPQREIGRPFTRPPPLSVDDAFAKLALLSEPRRPALQKQSLPIIEDVVKEEEVEAVKEKEAAALVEEVDSDDSEQESKNEDEEENGEANGDGIEDDYDDTVDIDSWMPDDAEQQVEEVQDDVRDIPRRKLESIEEVEQLDDEEDANVDEAKPDQEIKSNVVSPVSDESPIVQQPDEVASAEHANDDSQVSKQEPPKEAAETYDAHNERYANQQYYQQDDASQQQYQENPEYNQSYEQPQGEEQQNYQYPEDSNQYAYDANGQYTGYDGQQYTEAQYEEYMKQYQQYDPNQAYEQDPNQQYQPYEGYQTGQQADGTDQAHYDPNQVYDYSQDPQAYGDQAYDYSADQQAYAEAYAAQSAEHYGGEDQPQELAGEQVAVGNAVDESSVDQNSDHNKEENVSVADSSTKDKPKENKKKKDVIKSILDSDSESFIERNLSNTESDFDFN